MPSGNNQSTTDTNSVREDLDQLRADMSSILSHLREGSTDRAQAMGERIRETGKKAVDRGETTIRERPWTSVMLLFFVGLILGWALDRKLSA